MENVTAKMSNMTIVFEDKHGESLFNAKHKNSFLSNLFEVPQKQNYKFIIEGENSTKWELKLNNITTDYNSVTGSYVTTCNFEPIENKI